MCSPEMSDTTMYKCFHVVSGLLGRACRLRNQIDSRHVKLFLDDEIIEHSSCFTVCVPPAGAISLIHLSARGLGRRDG